MGPIREGSDNPSRCPVHRPGHQADPTRHTAVASQRHARRQRTRKAGRHIAGRGIRDPPLPADPPDPWAGNPLTRTRGSSHGTCPRGKVKSFGHDAGVRRSPYPPRGMGFPLCCGTRGFQYNRAGEPEESVNGVGWRTRFKCDVRGRTGCPYIWGQYGVSAVGSLVDEAAGSGTSGEKLEFTR